MSKSQFSSVAGFALVLVCLQSSADAGDPKRQFIDRAKVNSGASIRRAHLAIDAAVRLERTLETRPSGPGDFGQPYRYEYAGTITLTVYENLANISLGVSSKESQLFVHGLPRSWKGGSVNLKPGRYTYRFTFQSYNYVENFTVQLTSTPDFVRQNEIATANFRVIKPVVR